MLLLALCLRIPRLGLRPMHTDEAIEAFRAARVMETRRPAYDPAARHGPVLSLLNAGVLRLAGARSIADAQVWMVRLAPAIAGSLTALTPWFLAGIPGPAAAAAGVAIAVSPAFVYWSRDAIPEILLVLWAALLMGALLRARERPDSPWPWAAGLLAGLMIATKETAWLMFAAAGFGLLVAGRGNGRRKPGGRLPARVLGPVVVAACVAGALLGGFRGFAGPVRPYLELGLSGGDHAHPWWWYLGLVTWSRPMAGGPVWSEAAILVLAGIGVWHGRRVTTVRILAVYTGVLAAGYSAIPYKTPWCLLGFWWGAAVLAGWGAAGLLARGRSRPWRAALLAVAAVHLGWQAWRASFVFPADQRSPYTYAQSVADAARMGALVERLAAASPEGANALVAVIAPDPWPLPWYLRRLLRVGYWAAPGESGARQAIRLAPVVISPPGQVAPPGDRVVQLYGIRPGVVLAMSVSRALWEKALR